MYNDGLIDMRCRVCKQGMLGDPKDKRDVCDDCYQARLEAKAAAWDEVMERAKHQTETTMEIFGLWVSMKCDVFSGEVGSFPRGDNNA